MPWQVTAVAVQVQHRALDLDPGLGWQPPTVKADAISSGQCDIAVFQLGALRGEGLTTLGVEQQAAAAAKAHQDQAEDEQAAVLRECSRSRLQCDPGSGG